MLAKTEEPVSSGIGLLITRQGIGLELSGPIRIGPVQVLELYWVIPTVKFPVDISGGAAAFRNKRGRLERFGLEIDMKEWLAYCELMLGREFGKLERVLVRGTPRESAWVLESPEGFLAFDLLAELDVVEEKGAVHFHVRRARGISFSNDVSARISAERAVRALFGDLLARGEASAIPDLAEALCKSVFPGFGARLPETDGLTLSHATSASDVVILRAVRGAEPFRNAPSVQAYSERWFEFADAESYLLSCAFDRARRSYMFALERLRHDPECLSRVAEIDRAASLLEAAKLSLLDAPEPWTHILRGDLHTSLGEREEALRAFQVAAGDETDPALRALLLFEIAKLERDVPIAAIEHLSEAIELHPARRAFYVERCMRWTALGRTERAMADAETAEALSRSTHEKFEWWIQLAKAFGAQKLPTKPLFERALRHKPNEADALAGLGVALLQVGDTQRGIDLLKRALTRLRKRANVAENPWMVTATIALARALWQDLQDPMAALSRLRTLGETRDPFVFALEAEIRESLGDRVGCDVAWERVRDILALGEPEGPREAYRALDVELQKRGLRTTTVSGHERQAPPPAATTSANVAAPSKAKTFASEAELEQEIDRLTKRVQGSPEDTEAALQLFDLLVVAKRDLEALALISGQSESNPGNPNVRNRHASLLKRLGEEARREGRNEEADVFELVLGNLEA